MIPEEEFFVKNVFIQIDYPEDVSDENIRQLLHTLDLLPMNHLMHIPTITVGDRPAQGGGGSAHEGMPGGPYIRLNKSCFNSQWNSGSYNYTLLHEVGHIIDWAYGCMRSMRRENRDGYDAMLAHPHTGRTQGPGEHYADAYADYHVGHRMESERSEALLASQAFR